MNGKVVVVTGASGALGRVVAETALARGARVAGLDYAPSQIPATENLVKAFKMIDEAKKIGAEAIKENDDEKLAEAARLNNEAGAMHEESKAMFEKAKQTEPNSELGKRKREIANVLDVDVLAEKEQVYIRIARLPYLKSLNEQFIANYHKKEARIQELQDKKARLSWWASIATYAAISLQLFGLMFVLTRDLTRDKRKE